MADSNSIHKWWSDFEITDAGTEVPYKVNAIELRAVNLKQLREEGSEIMFNSDGHISTFYLIWAPGSLEEKVQNIVKAWEMEMFHKVDFDDLKSVDPIKYTFSLYGTDYLLYLITKKKNLYIWS
ncbi:pathogenesis-related family protein [Striga asiatica]|uniref:Pathogenesis-related family protein n=1 Tax=Striga asiatica TaxID=4170 RepID=A0A5A7QXW2_STRAF|nr:pathogenesis-related family protein [Striga asiatica]